MTPYKKRLNPFIQHMAEDMQLRNLAPATIDAYTYHVDKFCRHFDKPADQLGPEEIRQYQLFLVQEKKVSWSSFNQAVCGLRFLYEVTLQRPWEVRHIPFGKRPKKLPVVLSDEEASRLFECIFSLARRRIHHFRQPPFKRHASWESPWQASGRRPRPTRCDTVLPRACWKRASTC
jgi:site-specific recombinase XerD